MAKIPTTVVTGFLGAGKTTLIRHLLTHSGGRRLAVVVNEFGDVGVDGEILRGCGIETCKDEDIVELANGCICCTVADDFLPTMRKLIDRENPPEHIIVETSGLALPKPLVKAFTWPEVRTRATVDGVVALIDADAVAKGRFAPDEAALEAIRKDDPTLDHETPLEELFEEQLACADLVVLNKTDLLDEAGIVAVEAEVRKHVRGGAKIIRSAHGVVDAGVLLGLGVGAEDDLDSRPSHHDGAADDHDHDDFDTFVVSGAEVVDPQALSTALIPLIEGHDILRVKGVLAIAGKPSRMILQAVGPRLQTYFDRPWREGETRNSQLVVIGEKGIDQKAIGEAVEALLNV